MPLVALLLAQYPDGLLTLISPTLRKKASSACCLIKILLLSRMSQLKKQPFRLQASL